MNYLRHKKGTGPQPWVPRQSFLPSWSCPSCPSLMMGRGMGHWTLEIKMILLKVTYKLFKIHFSIIWPAEKEGQLLLDTSICFCFNNNTHITHTLYSILFASSLETSVITKDLWQCRNVDLGPNSTGVDQHLLQVFVIMSMQGSVNTCERQQEGKCYKELYSHWVVSFRSHLNTGTQDWGFLKLS